MNNVNLIGRLTVDWRRNDTSTRLSAQVAVDGYKGHTDFIPVVYLNEKNMDNIENNTRKGSLIGIQGRINSYKNKDNKTVISVLANNIEFLEPKNTGEHEAPNYVENNRYHKDDEVKPEKDDDILWN